jgi:G3E family GTPase
VAGARCQRSVHDERITSVGITEPGDLDMDKMNEWMGNLLREHGADIYRMKGVLAIKDAPAKFVFQGVHMQFDGAPHTAWEEGEARVSKLIFIGKKLDREELTAAFRACLVVPAQGGGAAGESKSSS